MPYQYPAGSIWRKWDLHAHTPLDHEWVNRPDLSSQHTKEVFAQEYVAAAIEQGLSVIAVTDHNFCPAVEQLLIPYVQRAAASASLTVLPGFEVSVSDCGGTHLLVIFPEDTDLSLIDQIVGQLFPPGTERFEGSIVKPSHKSALELNRVLEKSGVKYLIAFAHADSDSGCLNQHRGEHRAELWHSSFINIAQVSKHPLQSSAFYRSVADGTNQRYSRPITWVLGSDCRMLQPTDIDDGRFAIGERFTWIKADPTFEGLQQIVYEPEARVRLQDHEPELKPDYLTIKSIKFKDDNGRFQTDEIPINPYLTTIIGGKSTGKSILLSHMAEAIDPEEVANKTEVSQVNKYDFNNIDLEILWQDGTRDSLLGEKSNHRVTFLPQMYIHKLLEEEKRSSFSKSIFEFLKQDETFQSQYPELSEKADSINANLQKEVSNLLSIMLRRDEIKSRRNELGDQQAILDEKYKKEKEIVELQASSGFSEEETGRYKSLVAERANLKDRQEYNARYEKYWSALVKGVKSKLDNFNEDIIQLPKELKARFNISNEDFNIAEGLVDNLNENISNMFEQFSDRIDGILEKSNKINVEFADKLGQVQRDIFPFTSKFYNQEKLKELNELTENYLKTLSLIEELDSQYRQENSKLESTITAISGLASQLLLAKQDLVGFLNGLDCADVGDGIKISTELSFDHNRFGEIFINNFDKRKSLEILNVKLRDGSIIWSEEMHVDVLLTILKSIISIPQDALGLKSGCNIEDTVSALFRDYTQLKYSVWQNEEEIQMMSPGKQGLVLLELFMHLSQATYPILIDQPEDNLDNRTIYSHLTEYLKNKKLDRQIVLVTHNPNLVVGADAEQIIVANQDGEGVTQNEKFKFEYVSGSLECSFREPAAGSMLKSQGIREHVCQVLEGGEDAFRKREKKYGF